VKILCVNYEYPPIGGGGGVASKGLAEALVAKGHHIDVVTTGMRDLPEFEAINGVRIHRVKCIRRFPHYVTLPEMLTLVFPLYLKARNLIGRNNYDLNHTHFIFPSGLVSYLLKIKTGLPYILTCHGSDVPGYNPDRFHISHKLLRPFWSMVLRNSQGISTPSRYLRDLMQSKIDLPVDVIPNGYELPQCEPSPKRNRILVLTRMFERKGVQFFIRAMADLKCDWEIFIAGDGPYLGKLKDLARGMPSIQFLGFVREKQVLDLYASAKIFVFPSINENFPVVLLEAMNAGCAIITSDAPGCLEVVADAANICRCGSVSDLRRSLDHLIGNETEIERLSSLARSRASEFRWSSVACQFDMLFRRSLGDAGRSSFSGRATSSHIYG
jgi:glycosyltransferase involved in cell wall biosynthesis